MIHVQLRKARRWQKIKMGIGQGSEWIRICSKIQFGWIFTDAPLIRIYFFWIWAPSSPIRIFIFRVFTCRFTFEFSPSASQCGTSIIRFGIRISQNSIFFRILYKFEYRASVGIRSHWLSNYLLVRINLVILSTLITSLRRDYELVNRQRFKI